MIVPRGALPDLAAVAAHYDELDDLYRALWGTHLHHGYWLSETESPEHAVINLTRIVSAYAAMKPGDRVCDLGCGYGAAARPCFERVVDYLKKYRRPGSKVPDLETIKREQLAIFGTSENACAVLEAYKKIGVGHVICMVNFGGVPLPEVRRTLELIATQVFPAFSRDQ